MSDPPETEPEYEDRLDELDQLLDQLPEEVALLIQTRWAGIPPGPHTYWATCEIARAFADGVTPQVLRLADIAMCLAETAEDLTIEAAEIGFREIENTNIAYRRAETSIIVRRARNADRDAAIRAAWREREGISSKNQRAQNVVKALKRRAQEERWAMPSEKQIIRIAERNE